jgi:hypothetical protein
MASFMMVPGKLVPYKIEAKAKEGAGPKVRVEHFVKHGLFSFGDGS